VDWLPTGGATVRGALANLAESETSLLLTVKIDGANQWRTVVVGPPDSGGTGYRALRVAN